MPVTINGSGSIAGLSVGGLGNGGIVDADSLASNAVTTAKLHNDAVTTSHMPAGSVIQVKYAQSKTTIYRNSSSYGNLSAFNVSITPTSSSNILIYQYNLIVRVRENNEHGAFAWIAISDDAGSSYLAENYHRIYGYDGSGYDLDCSASSFAIKTAGSTSARNYYIYTKMADGDSYEINPANNQNNSAVTVMEIAA
tara:strand:+ start:99 stop:686 length:588 start_codon:yes stop_codon:yes gene_type:complete